MFDIAFSELLVIGVVALVVIGPERLPKVARTLGHLFGRLQRYVAQVKSDINREMEASELSKVKTEFESAARDFQRDVETNVQDADREIREVQADIDRQLQAVDGGAPASAPAAVPLPPQPEAAPEPARLPVSTPSPQLELAIDEPAGEPSSARAGKA
jgi:sec-independent protein translocase protein TatB